MQWELVAAVAALTGAVLVATGTWRWTLIGPTENPTPFDQLPLPAAPVAAGVALGSLPGALAAADLTAGGWWWLSVAALAAALAGPLTNIGRISAEVLVAELEVSKASGATTGHGDAHTIAGPVEGRLYRAAAAAGAHGDDALSAALGDLAGRARAAERQAAEFDEDQNASGKADRYTAMLRQVKLRPNRQFSDPANMPAAWPDWLKTLWTPFTRRIDAVRAIHTHQIEWIALYALTWLRPVLILAIPVLPAWSTAGLRPPVGTGAAADAAWALALVVSAAVAAMSPTIVPELQRKDIDVIPLARRLLLVEAPTWLLLIGTSPSWVAWSFGAMTFTCVERPGWDTRNAAITGIGGIAVLAVSLAARDAGAGSVLVECLAAIVLLALISTSYGLMLPLVVDRTLFAGRRARTAERRLERAVADGAQADVRAVLDDAAELVRRHSMSGREADDLLAVAAAAASRRRSLWPRNETLGDLVLDAARPLQPSPAADARLAPPIYRPEAIAGAAVGRKHQQQLERVIKAMLGEADRHAAGTITVTVVADLQELRIAVSNLPDPNSPPGASEGGDILLAEIAKLPGGRPASTPGLRPVRIRGRVREYWVSEVICSAEVLGRRT